MHTSKRVKQFDFVTRQHNQMLFTALQKGQTNVFEMCLYLSLLPSQKVELTQKLPLLTHLAVRGLLRVALPLSNIVGGGPSQSQQTLTAARCTETVVNSSTINSDLHGQRLIIETK